MRITCIYCFFFYNLRAEKKCLKEQYEYATESERKTQRLHEEKTGIETVTED